MIKNIRSLRWFLPISVFLIGIGALWFFPPRWLLNSAKLVDLKNPAATGETLVEKYKCRQCHFIDGSGKPNGPNMSGVTERFDEAELRMWLQDPRTVRWRTIMPNFDLSDSEIDAIVAYLMALDENP